MSWNFCSYTLLSFYKLIAISSWVNGSCGHNEIGIDHLEAGSHKLVLWGISTVKHCLDPFFSYLSSWPPLFFRAFWTQCTPFLTQHTALQGSTSEASTWIVHPTDRLCTLQKHRLHSDPDAQTLLPAGSVHLRLRLHSCLPHFSNLANGLTSLEPRFPPLLKGEHISTSWGHSNDIIRKSV